MDRMGCITARTCRVRNYTDEEISSPRKSKGIRIEDRYLSYTRRSGLYVFVKLFLLFKDALPSMFLSWFYPGSYSPRSAPKPMELYVPQRTSTP